MTAEHQSDRAHDETALAPLTLVTVVFEAEISLLELQARSLGRFVSPSELARIIVIDNTNRGLGARTRSTLLAEYGPHRDGVVFLRPDDICALPPARGWIGQQVLKLAVHEHITTPFYVVLDAKNHWLRPTSLDTFVNPDGRARGATHEYGQHPLRPTLERVLAYLGVDPAPWIESFPATHTPVVLATDLVRKMTADVAARSARTFAEEFVEADLTEFFLYSGWIIATYGGLEDHLDGQLIRSANVWPGRSSDTDFSRTLASAELHDAPFLSVHRTALARVAPAGAKQLAEFWVARRLFPDRRRALAFIAAFKVTYLWSMSLRKGRTLLQDRIGAHGRPGPAAPGRQD